MKHPFRYSGELRNFFVLWSTQSLSQLGSAMTAFALTLWLYERTGSALQTALLSVCSYAPYVLMSVFAGALSDRWNKKKTMMACDAISALTSACALALLRAELLAPAHMYLINALNGLTNTLQQPASDVAATLVTPARWYQRASALRSLSNALVTLLNPVLAAAVYGLAGMEAVIFIDLGTFALAFLALGFGVRIPEAPGAKALRRDPFGETLRSGLRYLRANRMILALMLFLACVNFVASAFDAALPAMVLSRPGGGRAALGAVSACAGVATLLGSLICMALPAPRDRIRVIHVAMLISLGTENFLLAFARTPALWCVGQLIGWLPVPLMNANLDVVLRRSIPVEMQGRVYACRNSLQFFTIPLGLALGGAAVDGVCEPWMARLSPQSLPARLFGRGKGSGAALTLFLLGLLGTALCLIFGRILKKYRFREEA